MQTLNPNVLERIITAYGASGIFKKNIKIFLYYRAINNEDNDYVYYLFNNKFDFTKNVKILNERFQHIEGYPLFYTNNEPYYIEPPKEDKNIQLTLPL